MRTARNMFIVNLAVSDALVCCVGTPLTLMELLTKHWPLPNWPCLCKACGAIQAISIFVSTISITAIALDRYQARLNFIQFALEPIIIVNGIKPSNSFVKCLFAVKITSYYIIFEFFFSFALIIFEFIFILKQRICFLMLV